MKVLHTAALVSVVFLLSVAPVWAQEKHTAPQTVVFSGAALGAGLGMALTIIGAGYGMGRLGAAAMESMARQPEVDGRVFTGMLIIAAMLEGATLASVVFCFVLGQSAWF